MEKDAVLVCTILGFLGSIAVTLGFVAHSYTSKSVGYNGTSCVYRSPPAMGCGILGVFLVLLNQAIVAAFTSDWCLCFCCSCFPCCNKRRPHPPPSKRRRLGVILSLFSWVLTIVAVVTFILGVTESSREEPPVARTPTSHACRSPETIGNFPTASLSSLIAVVLGIASYVLLETAAEAEQGIASGAGTGPQQRSQIRSGPAAGADQEADHISLATAA